MDGSPATGWSPDGARGALSVDLGRKAAVTSFVPRWSDVRPAAHRLETSLDGGRRRPYRSGTAAR
ncbi:hypothetical protein Sfulv_39540 [Streptomyces fulvorobeus]|uniref:F5/8 type C domain-containing protein n=1 Tax=Streptomyces fulvorobeus TaxID=284028 RepID=A0A7J0CB81_9ACTN|nr:hypothetical protein [Streptomyces fulvorobeus]GFM99143.1 hypothetical protein Sfulv_39540 [Streptomyces fulvorobeus]